MASYNIVTNIDAFLAQTVRLVGHGYYFYFQGQLKPSKDPVKLDQKMIEMWDLDKPAWKREKRRRGRAPSIWYLRFHSTYVLIATHGKSVDGNTHPFFEEYANQLKDVREHALYVGGYSIRYPVSKETGRRRVFVRLDRDYYLNVRSQLIDYAIRSAFKDRSVLEGRIARLPCQWYAPVRQQIRTITTEVNRRRRHAGYIAIRLGCIPRKTRVRSLEN